MTTRTITLSAEHWQTIKIALQRSSWRLDLCEDDLYVSPDLSAACDALEAALAQPEPEGPTEDEIDELYHFSGGVINVFARAVWSRAQAARPAIEPVGVSDAEIDKVLFQAVSAYREGKSPFGAPDDQKQLDRIKARAALARWGRPALAQPEPVGRPWPVPGDAEGLAEVFWGNYDQFGALGKHDPQRALERKPVPVAERLPGPTIMEIIAMADEIEEEGLGQVDLVRRALARWGQPTTPETTDEQP